ncbi:MAG: hypothetical protein HY264_11800 [Chloroflexi bacterium]|nr:hypothetical protein [Chloroflexota bacterium]
MTEPNLSGGGPDSASAPICPWCSAPLKTGTEETCPSCGAALHEVAESEVPGVTRVDHEAILKARAPAQRGRGLIGWLSGEYEAGPAPEAAGSIALPDEAVRREMIRLEMAALEAEAQARQAEVAAEIAEAHGATAAPDAADHDSVDASPPATDVGGDVPTTTDESAVAAATSDLPPEGSESAG